ncbi:unannotated protein [freshwater metagenome]|uniref:Unannotated protein n=1 Tax=freshwater metagenome TaxID=449393 RepID=A0A6J7VX70_9ZZZZ
MPSVKPFWRCTAPALVVVDTTLAALKENDSVVAVIAVMVRTPSQSGSIPLTTMFEPTVYP